MRCRPACPFASDRGHDRGDHRAGRPPLAAPPRLRGPWNDTAESPDVAAPKPVRGFVGVQFANLVVGVGLRHSVADIRMSQVSFHSLRRRIYPMLFGQSVGDGTARRTTRRVSRSTISSGSTSPSGACRRPPARSRRTPRDPRIHFHSRHRSFLATSWQPWLSPPRNYAEAVKA